MGFFFRSFRFRMYVKILQNYIYLCDTCSFYEVNTCSENVLYGLMKLLYNWQHPIIIVCPFFLKEQDTSCYSPKVFEVISYEELMRNSVPFEETDENFWQDFTSKKDKIDKEKS